MPLGPKRWEVETACDKIKTHLPVCHPIRSRLAPALAKSEIARLLPTDYAVCRFLPEPVLEAGKALPGVVQPHRLGSAPPDSESCHSPP